MPGNPLVGKTLVSVWLAKDREAIRFVLSDGGEVIARCDGDCCSSTWIEHVELPSLPAEVRAVDDVDLPESAQKPTTTGNYEEEMAYYGCKIATSQGDLLIEYRNSSNGYYGGSLSWPGEYYYGGVGGQNKSKEEWLPADKSDQPPTGPSTPEADRG